MIWFTSDTHFFHEFIRTKLLRPWNNITEMNEGVIEHWNSRVGMNDTVYHLGDFSLKCNKWEANEIASRLHGNISILPGNHDYPLQKLPANLELEVPLKTLILSGLPPIVLCHFKLQVWDKSHYNSFHLYGHSHGNLPSEGKSMDVGVDCNNFYPVSLDEIVEIMKTKPDNVNFIKNKTKVKSEKFKQLEIQFEW